jgi:hypothetical protein
MGMGLAALCARQIRDFEILKSHQICGPFFICGTTFLRPVFGQTSASLQDHQYLLPDNGELGFVALTYRTTAKLSLIETVGRSP